MCLLVILVLLLYVAVATFFATARVLLPWTITAAVLAALVTLVVSRQLRPRIGSARVGLTLPLTIALTLCFGYLAWVVKPASLPPAKPPKAGVEAYFELLFGFPDTAPSIDLIWKMLPVHLTIAGLLGGLVVTALVGQRVAMGAGESQKEACDATGDIGRVERDAAADSGRDFESS